MNRGNGNANIASDRALQFLECGGKPYSCSAGKTLMAIMPNGDVYPCRRLPIKVGNILEQSMLNIYSQNESIKALQNDICHECNTCYYHHTCNGGLKCLSYALYQDYSRKDPHCWL